MSEMKANTNRKIFNLSKLKINRISLLNQSNLNAPLKQLYIAKSKIRNMIKEINNNKSEEKQINVFFNPIKNKNMNINNKISPLSEKRKIVRKHNILQNIDFNMNLIQDKNNNSNDNNNNKSLELNLNNSKFNKSSFSRNNNKNLFDNKNKNNSSNSNFNFNMSKKINFDKTINLPMLKYSSEESIHNLKQSNYKTNSILSISLPKRNHINILNNYNIFKNKNKRKDEDKDKNKNEINMYNSYHKNKFNLNLNHEYNNKEEIIKISENIEESTSNDNNFDFTEIEKIISNSSKNTKSNKKINYYRNNNRNAYKNANEVNLKKDIFLNDLQQSKKDNLLNISNNKFINEIINDRIEISNNTNKVSQGTNTDRSRNINAYNQSNIFNENKSIKGMNISIHNDLLPYNYKKKNIRNNRTYHLHDSNNTNYFPKFL